MPGSGPRLILTCLAREPGTDPVIVALSEGLDTQLWRMRSGQLMDKLRHVYGTSVRKAFNCWQGI